ncbi:copper chaperone PCu(A)C [uncultured Paracoccus sp.]|uniref:copper chaperone PCu(A)C n=1 Tax=uncultured Paracoccus sp. TaxID=189685 RepID=UPI0025E917D5|nr:copper chaperone PCu(A)C [uncultured Paracoccus sp.]
MKRFATALGLAVMLPLAAAADCASVSAHGLTVTGAWSRATIGSERPAVFYVEIRNEGETADRLTGIETPVAAMPMLHRTVVEDGVASMPHAEAIEIPAGETVGLAPGGHHGMLMGLTAPLTEGESFPVTLQFERAGAVEIDTRVLSIRAQEAQCDAG